MTCPFTPPSSQAVIMQAASRPNGAMQSNDKLTLLIEMELGNNG